MITINYFAILVCAILGMGLGYAWYGPLFGKRWMHLTGADKFDDATRRERTKEMWRLMVIQFLLSLLQVYVLAYLIIGRSNSTGVESAVWIWLGFVMPSIAATSMWSAEPKGIAKSKFFIQAGYQLVLFIIFGIVLGAWR